MKTARHKIGILSDTHGLIRPEVKKALEPCEVILHGGDINRQAILDDLNKIAPVYAVRGNNDKEWADGLPETLELDLFGIRIFMIHNKKFLPEDLGDRNLIIYGHSHKYEQDRRAGRIWLNPGSCGPRRFNQPITMAILEADEGKNQIRIEKIEIPYSTGSGERESM